MVHGPCPKKIFETMADNAPVKKPASAPKYIPVIIVIAATGLKPGITTNNIRPATEIAAITAIVKISRGCGFLLSNFMKSGTHASNAITTEIK